ncbi:hypothetical protein O6H91_13G001600 [Diphasiastrum complanatum]|nr:hypothetical protein O6H91_13G001500 [Diphasiastrum complanatum]KAJ7532385.1 hypothetical protein O6H91_13G001600 [Diphasiastrum complanatum]
MSSQQQQKKEGNSSISSQRQEKNGFAANQQLFRRLSHSLGHSLVLFSAYRFSSRTFLVISLASVHLREKLGDPVHSCLWRRHAGSLHLTPSAAGFDPSRPTLNEAIATLYYINDTHGRPYDVLVTKCVFEDQAASVGHGRGSLFLNLSSPITERKELVLVYDEFDLSPSPTNKEHFSYEFAYCSPPIWGDRWHALYVKQWLMYHHALTEGKIHYFIYLAVKLSSNVTKVFQPLIGEGLMTIIDISEERHFQTWYHGQQLVINDCLGRARQIARWALFWDFDEYLHITQPLSLATLLQQHERSAWISFGSVTWSTRYCSAEEEWIQRRWAVERMVFRLESPECGEKRRAEVCHGSEGHRKWAANPREVVVGSIHYVLDPLWGGAILNTSIARINHYRGIATCMENCSILKNLSQVDESTPVDGWWWKDTGIRKNVANLQSFSNNLRIFA